MKFSFGFSLLLFGAQLTAANLTPELPVSAPIYQHAEGNQTGPAIASDGTDFLVVWSDGRAGRDEMYATRVNALGEVLDRTGIRIGAGSRFITALWSGTSYVILWTDERYNQRSIKIARVAPDGTLIDAPRTLIANAYAITNRFAATNGSRIVVVYERVVVNSFPSFHLAVLDRDGASIIVDQPIPHGPVNSHALTVTSNGTDFLAVWTAFWSMRASHDAIRINSDGIVADVASRTLINSYPPADGPLVTSDGEDYLVFLRSFAGEDLRVIRVNANAQVVAGPHSIEAPSQVTISQPEVVWSGTNYLLMWADIREHSVRTLPLDRDGRALQQAPTTVAQWISGGLVASPAIAIGNGRGLMVWNNARPSPGLSPSYDVVGAGISLPALTLTGQTLLSISAPRQTEPSVAFGGDNYLAAWNEESGVYVSRIALDGTHLDGRGIQIAEPSQYFTHMPRVTFDGENYLVAWVDAGAGIRTALIAPADARLLPAASDVVTDCALNLAMAPGTHATLITWTDCGNRAIKASRVGRDGRVIDPVPLEVSRSSGLNTGPSIAWNGSTWLVAWEEGIEVPSALLGPFQIFRKNIWAARVTGELTLLDPQAIPIAVSLDGKQTDQHPSVASDGSEFIVAWDGGGLWSGEREVRAKHVKANGLVTETEPLRIAVGSSPAAVWNGQRYLIAWQEVNSSTDIIGTQIGRADEPVARMRIPIATSATDESSVFLTPSGPGRVTATYTRIALEPLYGGVERGFLRHVLATSRSRSVRR